MLFGNFSTIAEMCPQNAALNSFNLNEFSSGLIDGDFGTHLACWIADAIHHLGIKKRLNDYQDTRVSNQHSLYGLTTTLIHAI